MRRRGPQTREAQRGTRSPDMARFPPLLARYQADFKRVPTQGQPIQVYFSEQRKAAWSSMDAFISHSSEDAEIAGRVQKILGEAGLTVWLDHSALRFGVLLRGDEPRPRFGTAMC